jgi:hypothetical protein
MGIPGEGNPLHTIDARLLERGFQVAPLGEDFLKAREKAQRDKNLVAAAASWYNNQDILREDGAAHGSVLYFTCSNQIADPRWVTHSKAFSDPCICRR